jgi:hypothetical protein
LGAVGLSALRLALLALVSISVSATAAVRLRLDAEASFDDAPTVRLLVTNGGDQPASSVLPDLAYERQRFRGEGITLAPGERHEWRFALPPPAGPGTVPATFHVGYAVSDGAPHALPWVVLVSTPAAQVSPVRTSLTTTPGVSFTEARLLIDNPGLRPIAGRVVFVLPTEVHTEPESYPVQVAAGAQRVVPTALEGRGAQPNVPYSVFAVLEYLEDGMRYAVVAHTDTTVPAGAAGRAVPLAVGGLALVSTLALLGVALRRSAARARGSSTGPGARFPASAAPTPPA